MAVDRIIDQMGDLSGRVSDVLPANPVPIARVAGVQTDETWGDTNCTIAADTDDYVNGIQSLKITVDSGAVGVATCELPFSVDVRSVIGVAVKVDDLSKLDSMAIYIDENTDPDGYTWTFYDSDNRYFLVNGQWAVVWLVRVDSSSNGSPTTWSNGDYAVAQIRLELDAAAGQSPVVRFGGVYTQKQPKAAFLLNFDDGPVSTRSVVADLLKANGRNWSAGASIAYTWVGTSSYAPYIRFMTAAEITELYDDYGWDIHPHWASAFNSSSTEANIMVFLEQSQRYNRGRGWFRGSDFAVWPGNRGDMVGRNVTPYLSKCGYTGARGWSHRTAADVAGVDFSGQPHIPMDVWNFPYVEINETTAAAANQGTYPVWATLQQVIEDRQITIPFFHAVVAAPDNWSITPETFTTFLEWCDPYVASGELEIITYSQLQSRTFAQLRRLPLSRSA